MFSTDVEAETLVSKQDFDSDDLSLEAPAADMEDVAMQALKVIAG